MITKEQKKRFKSICKQLNDLMGEIQETVPEACYYLASSNLNLMKGPDHTDDCHALRSNSVASIRIYSLGGGDW